MTALGAVGCSRPTTDECPSSISRAIYGGTADASSVGLPAAVASAVGALTTTSDAGPPELCSGVLISPTYLLTAAHCAAAGLSAEMRVSFGSAAYAFGGPPCGAVSEVDTVVDVVRHATADAMLVHLAAPAHDPTPVAIAAALPSPGTQAITAGYGLTENNTVGARLFLATVVTNADHDQVVVNSGSDAGACTGDSGGPLFIQADGASWQLAGVLHAGNASCTGEDIFTATPALEPWIASVTMP